MSENAIVVCTWSTGRDGLPEGVEEVLHIGRSMASALDTDLAWLVLGPLPESASELAGKYGVGQLQHAADPNLDPAGSDACVEAIAAYWETHSPATLIVHQTNEARVVAPRVAGRLGKAVVMNGISVETVASNYQITASAYGGDTRAIYEVSSGSILSFIANAVVPEPAEGAPVAPEALSLDLSGVDERIQVVEQASFDGPRLDDAEIIVSGGRGLGGADNDKLIEQLAAALGGLPGASRPIVDEGWVDSSHQVGLTGRITRPNLYIAVGISGASQHMAGCSAAGTIVAINRDADAAIFQHARYGIQGDALEILPELIRAANAR